VLLGIGAALPAPASARTLLGCRQSAARTICLYHEDNGSCSFSEVSNGKTLSSGAVCPPVWERFSVARGRATAVAQVYVAMNVEVLVENASGQPLRTIRLGRLAAGTRHLRFRVGTLSPGTHAVVIEALPPGTGAVPVRGPNAVTFAVRRRRPCVRGVRGVRSPQAGRGERPAAETARGLTTCPDPARTQRRWLITADERPPHRGGGPSIVSRIGTASARRASRNPST
jgi:hypothetical protein